MNRFSLLLLLLLVACGPPEVSTCRTHCGAYVIAPNAASVYSCHDYRELELTLADELSRVIPDACSAWAGLRLIEVPGDNSVSGWVERDGGLAPRLVSGWTDCFAGQVSFHTFDGVYRSPFDGDLLRRPWHTALTHELIHGAQRCQARLPVDPGADLDHANWYRDRLYDVPGIVADRLDFRTKP